MDKRKVTRRTESTSIAPLGCGTFVRVLTYICIDVDSSADVRLIVYMDESLDWTLLSRFYSGLSTLETLK